MARSALGVVGYANDRVARWFEVWGRSLRRFNPDIPVAVVPYDENAAAVRLLCGRFGFDFQEGDFSRWDQLGAVHYPNQSSAQHAYRKLAAFEGPFDSFLFLDVDGVVLSDLSELLLRFDRAPLDLAYFDKDLEQVYRPGAWRDGFVARTGAVGFNAGSFLSRTGLFQFEEFMTLAEEALESFDSFVPLVEQPFLNFCFDQRRLRVGDIDTIVPGLGPTWPGDPVLAESENISALLRRGRPRRGVRSPFVHWAGLELKWAMPLGKLWRKFAPAPTRLSMALDYLASGLVRRGRILARRRAGAKRER